jgi:hypothetical protein
MIFTYQIIVDSSMNVIYKREGKLDDLEKWFYLLSSLHAPIERPCEKYTLQGASGTQMQGLIAFGHLPAEED